MQGRQVLTELFKRSGDTADNPTPVVPAGPDCPEIALVTATGIIVSGNATPLLEGCTDMFVMFRTI